MNILRPHAEVAYRHELDMLMEIDDKPKPPNWLLSPWAVVQYIIGGKLSNGKQIEPKYIGSQRLIEMAVATLATDRALLLIGVPGTAKSWVSEHLAAAISGDSTLLVQGTAGLSEDALRYGWNYARLLAEGPSDKSLVESPVMRGMREGKMVRIEELTRLPSDVQDALITVLSEKTLPIPELNSEVQAVQGFNVIATANDRDRGVNDLSSALRRRFHTVSLPLPEDKEEEIMIVKTRLAKLEPAISMPPDTVPLHEIQRLVTIFRELRSGKTEDGKTKLKSPTSTLSTAEAISTLQSSQALAVHFGKGKVSAADIAAVLTGSIIKDPTTDNIVWKEYVETVIKSRKEWADLYKEVK